MITIDRRSPSPIFEQLVKQLRYLIAIGHFDLRDNLPSTRSLAESLGVSFHTVRKAYQTLERDGILQSTVGSGYRVRDPSPLGRSDRLERGAAVMAESLQQLVGLGLSESEIEYLVDEQLGLLETRSSSAGIAFLSPSLEIAEQCAKAIRRVLQQQVVALVVGGPIERPRPDYVITEFRDVSEARRLLSSSEVIGLSTHLSPSALDAISRLLGTETLGLLTRDAESIRYLSDRVRREAGFGGQIVATGSADPGLDLADFFRGVALVAHTEATGRRARSLRNASLPVVTLSVVPDEDSLQSALDILPTGLG